MTSPLPTILRQFPEASRSERPLASDVVYFCQYEGCGQEVSGPRTHVFMLTDKETNTQTYGVCLTFPHLFNTHSTHQESSEDAVSIQEWGVLSVCLLSRHPFFNFLAKCLKTLAHFMEHFGSKDVSWNGLLRGERAHSGSGTGSYSNRTKVSSPLVAEIEEWINSLLRLPVPEAGRCGLEVELEVEPEMLVCYPPKGRLPFLDLHLCPMFQRVGVHMVMEIIKLVLSEQKVRS